MGASSKHGAQLERRRCPRHRTLYLRFHSPMPGEIVNLSESGMAIETLVDLPPGYELTFRLRRNAGCMELSGWIRWCRRVRTISTSDGRELQVFHSGVEFNGSTAEAVRRCVDALPLRGEIAEGMPESASGLRSRR